MVDVIGIKGPCGGFDSDKAGFKLGNLDLFDLCAAWGDIDDACCCDHIVFNAFGVSSDL